MNKIIRTVHYLLNISKYRFFLSVILSCSRSLLPLIQIYLMQKIVNLISVNQSLLTSKELYNVILIYTFALILELICEKMAEYNIMHFRTEIELSFTEEILTKVCYLSLSSFEESDVQNKVRRICSFGSSTIYTTLNFVLEIIINSIVLFVSVIYVIKIDTNLLFPLCIVSAYSSLKFIDVSRKNYEIDFLQTEQRKENWYFNFLITQNKSFKELKVFGGVNKIIKKIKSNIMKFFSDEKYLFWYSLKKTGLWQVYNIIIVIYVLIRFSSNGNFNVGDLLATIQIVNKYLGASQSMLSSITTFNEKKLLLTEVFDFLDSREANSRDDFNLESFKKISIIHGSVKCSDTIILEEIQLDLEQGNVYFVVGENGAGKTSLIKCLCGLYELEKGEIYLDDRIVRKSEELLNYCSVQFQDFTELEMDVIDNIYFSAEEKDSVETSRVLCQVGLKTKVNSLPQKEKTRLGTWFSNSVNLSGGEWQRLAIARALSRDAKIYLFDEPTSMQDLFSKERIIKILRKLSENSIVVIINHNIENLRPEDNVIFISNKIVNNVQIHQQLIEDNHEYAEFVRRDSNEKNS